MYGGTMMGYLPLPICPVNGNIVQSHRSLARTPQTAFQTSHHRHAAYLAIFDLESALSRSPWGSWRRSQELGRQSAQTPEHWITLSSREEHQPDFQTPRLGLAFSGIRRSEKDGLSSSTRLLSSYAISVLPSLSAVAFPAVDAPLWLLHPLRKTNSDSFLSCNHQLKGGNSQNLWKVCCTTFPFLIRAVLYHFSSSFVPDTCCRHSPRIQRKQGFFELSILIFWWNFSLQYVSNARLWDLRGLGSHG